MGLVDQDRTKLGARIIQAKKVTKSTTEASKESIRSKRLACANCRKRRKKCDLNYPCGSCHKLGAACNVNEDDKRKQRYRTTYVRELEVRMSDIENNLREMMKLAFPGGKPLNDFKGERICELISDCLTTRKNLHSCEDDDSSVLKNFKGDMIDSQVCHEKHSNVPKADLKDEDTKAVVASSSLHSIRSLLSDIDQSTILSSRATVLATKEKKRKPMVNKSIYPEGPIGYHKNKLLPLSSLISISSRPSYTRDSSDYNTTNGNLLRSTRIADLETTRIVRPLANNHRNKLNTDPNILKCLSNFYRWLYPGHFIFLHRESFLYGFFYHSENNYHSSNYCSSELIYAMCAVGSRLSPDIQHLSDHYFEMSKNQLMKIVFDEESVAKITTVQALFCLAFYELGKGLNQLAWYFSGLAVRVGYEIGFHLDPKIWHTEDHNGPLTKSELAIRSRIYWGCYVADHFICLILGRNATLSVSNSTIPESDELPEVDGTEDFRFVGKHVLQISLPLKNLIVLSRIIQIFTSKIFIETGDIELKVVYVQKFNSQVYRWRKNLPDFLQWSQNIIQDQDSAADPTICYFWYYYYIVLLTFNKPFIEDSSESKATVLRALSDLETLFENFEKKMGNFNNATLYMLYACLLAINCLYKLKDQGELHARSLKYFCDIFYQKLHPAFMLPKRLLQDDLPAGNSESISTPAPSVPEESALKIVGGNTTLGDDIVKQDEYTGNLHASNDNLSSLSTMHTHSPSSRDSSLLPSLGKPQPLSHYTGAAENEIANECARSPAVNYKETETDTIKMPRAPLPLPGDQVSNINNYTHDVSLSYEIDDFINSLFEVTTNTAHGCAAPSIQPYDTESSL